MSNHFYLQISKSGGIMARIVTAVLSASKRNSDWEFTVRGTARFLQHECGIYWAVLGTLYESDVLTSDDRLCGVNRMDGDNGSNQMEPSDPNHEYTFEVHKTLSNDKVDTEPGRESIYAKLVLFPLNPPPPLQKDKITTNTVLV